MGRFGHKPKKKKKKPSTSYKKRNNTTDICQEPDPLWNFLPQAGIGCHIARPDQQSNDDDWVLEWETVDSNDYSIEECADLAVDTDEHTLTLCNLEPELWKVAFITIYNCIVKGRHGQILTSGCTTSSTPESLCSEDPLPRQQQCHRQCTTLIVLCPPLTFAHLCYLPSDASPSTLQLDSDVQPWNRHPDPSDTHATTISFPLQSSVMQPNFLCTQGVGGYLTHFFAGNLHAIDFQCPIGTPLLAVGNGHVVAVKTDATVSGIAVSNLFQWNSILIKLDNSIDEDYQISQEKQFHVDNDLVRESVTNGSLFVEYVHIATAVVVPNEYVQVGQVIGTSGCVGFSPEPHLHLACYRSDSDTAPTCRVYIRTNDNSSHYLPTAGKRYNCDGPILSAKVESSKSYS